MLLANGLTYPAFPEARELSSTVVIRRRDSNATRVTLGGVLDRALWRELYSLTVKRVGLETVGGPLVLQNLADLPAESFFDLWVGALVTDKKKAALILDALEAVFHVPARMLTDDAQQTYESGVEYAQGEESKLRRAITFYRLALETNEPEAIGLARRVAKLNKVERQQLARVSSKAEMHYWTDVENQVHELLAIVEDPTVHGVNAWSRTKWGQSIRRASRAAFEHACPHETPRQIRAYALGLNALLAEPAKQSEIGTQEEDEA
jgi:CRISPR system Cascade subunit CasA